MSNESVDLMRSETCISHGKVCDFLYYKIAGRDEVEPLDQGFLDACVKRISDTKVLTSASNAQAQFK